MADEPAGDSFAASLADVNNQIVDLQKKVEEFGLLLNDVPYKCRRGCTLAAILGETACGNCVARLRYAIERYEANQAKK